MRLLSENSPFHSVFGILLIPCSPYFKSLHPEHQIFWGEAILFQYFLLQPWHLLIPKAAMSTTSGKLSWESSWEHGGEQSISFSTRISSAAFIWCGKAYVDIYFHKWFLLFLFCTIVPFMPVFIFTGLCLAPLDGTETCGFVFSCRAAEWASLLLNSSSSQWPWTSATWRGLLG